MGKAALAALQRRLCQHDAAERRLLFYAAGYVRRAGRQHARLLDVKFHVLLPQSEGVGGALDYYQWQAILRSVSGLRSYHWVYHDRLKPWLVAELLILRPEMPRSPGRCSYATCR